MSKSASTEFHIPGMANQTPIFAEAGMCPARGN